VAHLDFQACKVAGRAVKVDGELCYLGAVLGKGLCLVQREELDTMQMKQWGKRERRNETIGKKRVARAGRSKQIYESIKAAAVSLALCIKTR
jgi:hypothetical protein